MAYSAKAIANEFLTLASQEGKGIPQMKIQKLVYIAHGFHLALLDKPLIEENVEAWQYGPVIRSLYNEFKGFGNREITSPATNVSVDDDFNIIHEVPKIPLEDTTAKALIEAVWRRYKVYSGANLSDLTHRNDTPWSDVFVKGVPNLIIGNELISEHYKSMISAG